MKINNRIVEAYLNCKYKAYLLLKGETGTPHDYEVLMNELQAEYRPKATGALLDRCKLESAPTIATVTLGDLKQGHPLILDCTVETDQFQFRFDGLKRVDGRSLFGSFSYQPVMFHHEDSAKEKQKLLLACGAHVFGQMQGTQPDTGLVMFGSSFRTTNVKPSSYSRKLQSLLADSFTMSEAAPPGFFLNDHCAACEFQETCRRQAGSEDHLSLLRRMTENQAKNFRKKGIFTVYQLSHTFRPRRRSKRHRHLGNPHSFALQALAIREKRIHVVGAPDVPESPVRVYVDVEGNSNGRSIYLIGLLIASGTDEKMHSFWADTQEQEAAIFDQLLATMAQYKNFSLFHYGNYELAFFKRMREETANRTVADRLLDRSCNVLSLIYSNIYFPTYSNSLKDIGDYLGCRWSDPNASGLQSLVWRQRWERSSDNRLKERLTQYNYEDCTALRTLTEAVYMIAERHAKIDGLATRKVASDPDITWVQEERPSPGNREWKTKSLEIPNYDYISKAAYFDYQRERVYVRTNPRLRQLLGTRSIQPRRKHRANQQVNITCRKCPLCGSREIKQVGGRTFAKQTFDLKLISSGIVRRVTEYHAKRISRCSACKRTYLPPKFRRLDPYRHSLKSWVMYQHVAHQVSQPRLETMLQEFFGVRVEHSYVHMMKALLARFYRSTYRQILERILSGELIHADETEFKLKFVRGYVWVLTNLEDVYFFYGPSREGAFLKDMLEGFQGVLVSDFYAAYDSLPCLQQKCLVHLIRDFNGDLLKNPFDDQLRAIASGFGNLLREIVDTIDRRGLRRRWLGKHKKDVDRFYRRFCTPECETEAAESFRKKLVKYRRKLFAFLDHNGVPWNNNNAERAIKEVAYYRVGVEGLMSETGIHDYLVLLSVLTTCKFKGVSPLRFLMSRERDIEEFAKSGKSRKRRPVIEVYPKGFPTRYPGKGRARRSQLRATAKKNGVDALYDKSVEVIRTHFNLLQGTVDGLAFLAPVGQRPQLQVFSLLPGESGSDDGLRYNVYTEGLAEHLGVNVGRAKQMLPAYRSLDEARRGIGEFGGGYFRDESDVVEFGGELEKVRLSVSPDEHP